MADDGDEETRVSGQDVESPNGLTGSLAEGYQFGVPSKQCCDWIGMMKRIGFQHTLRFSGSTSLSVSIVLAS